MWKIIFISLFDRDNPLVLNLSKQIVSQLSNVFLRLLAKLLRELFRSFADVICKCLAAGCYVFSTNVDKLLNTKIPTGLNRLILEDYTFSKFTFINEK